MPSRVAVVTGSNSGIGFATVRALCHRLEKDAIIYLTSRSVDNGKEAIRRLKEEGLNPSFHQLDVDDEGSITKLRDHLEAAHGGIDILINNAGVMYQDGEMPKSAQAGMTMRTNYFGLLNVTNMLLPLLRENGRIVNIASMAASMIFDKMSEELKKRFKEVANHAQSEQEVSKLMMEFVEEVKADTHVEKGWGDWSYGTSKLGVVALTRIQGRNVAKDSSKKGVLINACSPGYVATKMTAHLKNTDGMISVEESVENPLHLTFIPAADTEPQGKFFAKLKEINIFRNDSEPP